MRLEITQRADLAVRALVLLKRSPSRLKSADLAAALGTTAGFVPHVMGPLVRAGWVRSVPGPTGGYEAVVALDALSVLEIVEEVDGPTESGRCVVADRSCDAAAPCALHVAWARARRELVASLAGLPLAAVAVTA
ncbi:MAG: Rrf2 family transcriptional regulator [Ilumatobacter sp.]|uniref:RrF2 family transcriptional regulator n=1 Tax=Ilumatobacter sp. TaxID=1967498 RepID=UPI00329A5894